MVVIAVNNYAVEDDFPKKDDDLLAQNLSSKLFFRRALSHLVADMCVLVSACV
jgi:hypothetical protein